MSYTDNDDNEEMDMAEMVDSEMSVDDYGFVIGPDGMIKAVFMPDTFDSLPDNVQQLFTIFGVSPQLMTYSMSSAIH